MAKKQTVFSPEERLSTYKKSPKTAQKKSRPLSYIYFPKVVQDVIGIEGAPISNVTFLGGFSDTGKTTSMLSLIVQAQKQNILPVILITEKKFSFIRSKIMGMDCNLVEVVDETTGEVQTIWDGFFIYKDDFIYSQELYKFMDQIMDDQLSGELPFNVCFFVDSLNKLPCSMSYEKAFDGGGGNMHNARVNSELFGGVIEPRITRSKYLDVPYTSTLVAIMRGYSGSDNMGVITYRGGQVFKYDAGVNILHGGKTASAIQDEMMTINGEKVKIGIRTTMRLLKNHISPISKEGKIVIMPNGFISIDEVDQYKKENKNEIKKYLSEIAGKEDIFEEPEDIVE
jgi:hypothetical protein